MTQRKTVHKPLAPHLPSATYRPISQLLVSRAPESSAGQRWGAMWSERRALQVSWYAVFWVAWRALVTLAVVIVVAVFARSFISVEQDTFPLRAALFVDGVVLDSPVLAVDEHTFRRLPGVIDGAARLVELDGSVCYGPCAAVPFAAKFSVGDVLWWYHRKEYEILSKVPTGVSGPGGVRQVSLRRLVQVRQPDGALKDAVLVADVWAPRGAR